MRPSVRFPTNESAGRRQSYREQITFVADRPGHDRRYASDATKIERNWAGGPPKPCHGLGKTVRWYLDNPTWVRNVTSGTYREWVGKHYGG
ncbi:MAG: hypothetical protein U1E96_10635 [Azonexus sp.]